MSGVTVSEAPGRSLDPVSVGAALAVAVAPERTVALVALAHGLAWTWLAWTWLAWKCLAPLARAP